MAAGCKSHPLTLGIALAPPAALSSRWPAGQDLSCAPAAVAVSPIIQGCLQLISLDLLHFMCQLRGFSLYARSL